MWLEDEVGTNKYKLPIVDRLPLSTVKGFALLLVHKFSMFCPAHFVHLFPGS